MTTGQWLRRAASRLQDAGIDSARLDAELLLMHAWQVGRVHLIAHSQDELPPGVREEAERLLDRRSAREPLAYITGTREFWSRDFAVGPSVLIPRPETEHLIEAVLARFPERDRPWRFADIGTGSGCLAVTLACEYPAATVTATDISTPALALAARNAERHGVAQRINFRQGDLFAALYAADGPFDAIVSNPPYVGAAEMDELEPELGFEPREALTEEYDGLHYLERLVEAAAHQLNQHGLLIVETGVCGLPVESGTMQLDALIHDLAGHLRGGIYKR